MARAVIAAGRSCDFGSRRTPTVRQDRLHLHKHALLRGKSGKPAAKPPSCCIHPTSRRRQNSAIDSPLISNSRSNATRQFYAEILRIPQPATPIFRHSNLQTVKDQPLTLHQPDF
jgi:hypothetical protein